MEPSRGEVAAIVGYGGQYELAARIVLAKLSTLEWIRVADPEAGVADDFQFKSGPTHHALQVKWSQLPGSFTWADLTSPDGKTPSLWTRLATAWSQLRGGTNGPLRVMLCTNNHPANSKATKDTPIGKAAAPGSRSFALFLAVSFEPVRQRIADGTDRWDDLGGLPEVQQWEPVWQKLRDLADLNDEDFVRFCRDLDLRFGVRTTDPLVRPDQAPIDHDAAHLAQTLQDIVRDPSRPGELSREQFMRRLGWTDRIHYRHPHQFPMPIVHTTNEAARARLESALTSHSSGYLGLIGPAGSGKSTLLASLNLVGHVARYYAFVPDAPGPLSGRGEAANFLHDLTLALEASGLYRSGYGHDLTAQHAVLHDQLDHAGLRWTRHGERTIIIVDGLDHITREQNPARSLLDELPAPSSLPPGVFVILGTQTADILPTAVRIALEQPNRTVQLPPLSPSEVHQLARASGLQAWLHPADLSRLVDVSEGHPLALTYLLAELNALAASEPDVGTRRVRAATMLTNAARYGGDIERRYQGYFQAVGDDTEILDLLAMVARLRVPIDLTWLATWAEARTVSAFAERAAVFFHRDGSRWRFIHNSFRKFLADETAKIAGYPNAARDRQLHERLADVCADSGDQWLLYRDEESTHRFLAGQHDRVLELTAPERLRRSLLDLRPASTVRTHALLALRSANENGDSAAILRTLLFLNELRLRGIVLEAEPLATAVHEQDSVGALEHIVSDGRLRVSIPAALDHAVWFAADNDTAAAQEILRACGSLSELTVDDRLSCDAVADWAEAIFRLSGLGAVLAELDHHFPLPVEEDTDPGTSPSSSPDPRRERQRREHISDVINSRLLAHSRCFDLLAENRDDNGLDELTTLIDAEAPPDWRAQARLVRARIADEDSARSDVRKWIREIVAIIDGSDGPTSETDTEPAVAGHQVSLGLRCAAAELLVRNGFHDCREIDQLVPLGTVATWPADTLRDNGLEPFNALLALNGLRKVRPDPTLPDLTHTVVDSPKNVGTARFRRALGILSQLEGQQLAASAGLGDPPVVAAHADPIVRLLEVPSDQTRDWTGWYFLRDAALGLFRRIVGLAAESGGATGLMRLLNLFDNAWDTAERAPYWPPDRKHAVILAAVGAHSDVEEWARARLTALGDEITELGSDPHELVSTWLAQARAWSAVGDGASARRAARCAVRASLGVGISDHDEQLTQWLDWLAIAVNAGRVTSDEQKTIARRYASRIASATIAASQQAETACERLIALVFPTDSALACELAEWLCESGSIEEADAIQAVLLAAARHPEIPVGVTADAAAHMLHPIMRHMSRDIIDALGGQRDEDPGQSSTDGPPLDQPIETVGALLVALRGAESVAHGPAEGWDSVIDRTASGVAPIGQALALLAEATRLRLGQRTLGGLAALAARSGAAAEAVAALSESLSRTPGYGWLHHTDGGTRLTLFEAALRDRHPALVQLARNDLAGTLETGGLSGHLSPAQLRRIVDLVADPETPGSSWPDIENYLDLIAPAAQHCPDQVTPVRATPLGALADWVVRYLGHPVRPLDFGARRALRTICRHDPEVGQRALSDAVDAGGWTGEAALDALLGATEKELPAPLSAELARALRAAVVGSDAILRDLARRLAHRHDVPVVEAPGQSLPVGYSLALPPLPERKVPELDRRGIPHLDQHDPQQLVAPFDEPLLWLARQADLDDSAVLHRAAAITATNTERWTRDGHRGHAGLLMSRQQHHTFRPWAYLAGRRALGAVLAELLDAGLLGDVPDHPAYALGLICGALSTIESNALPSWMPLPWRPEGTRTHDVAGWCRETARAAREYAAEYSCAAPYVLAELARWKTLDWGTPKEKRLVCPTFEPRRLSLPAPRSWASMRSTAEWYPNGHLDGWTGHELILRCEERWTDSPYTEWLALHPGLGVRLGWRHDSRDLFTWRGSDGTWRARTVLSALGQLSDRPPSAESSAEVWQVQLSEQGRAELLSRFPRLTRSLTVIRTLPADPRQDRPTEETATERVELAEPTMRTP